MKSFSELTSASQVNNEDLLAISQTSGNGYASKKTTVKEIADFSNLNLAEEYDSTSTYAVDDYVIYESVLYKCTASTTGSFDNTKWTAVVVTDEMGSGGGGGTGGHTIIDENGNSMTARAGLQFVGGANVSDDNTNNKTIVDLASAGGIDGVFIDTENVIQAQTSFVNNEASYTATEDCAVVSLVYAASNLDAEIDIDNVMISLVYGAATMFGYVSTNFLKKGQTISFRQTFTSSQGNYTVYGIQTGTTHSKFQPVIYSTEEREIGVWTDGKPLYEKTFNLSKSDFTKVSAGIYSFTSHGILNIDKIIDIEGILKTSSYGIVKLSGKNYIANTSNSASVELANYYSGVMAYDRGNSVLENDANWTCNLTYRYTKTTDVAGSGSWTPQGVPTHHYSTDEHIVGTWIDGSTLYEKTWDLGSDIAITNWTTIMNLTGIDQLIKSESIQNDNAVSFIEYWIDGTTLKGKTLRDNNATDYVRYLTLQYTKTS